MQIDQDMPVAPVEEDVCEGDKILAQTSDLSEVEEPEKPAKRVTSKHAKTSTSKAPRKPAQPAKGKGRRKEKLPSEAEQLAALGVSEAEIKEALKYGHIASAPLRRSAAKPQYADPETQSEDEEEVYVQPKRSTKPKTAKKAERGDTSVASVESASLPKRRTSKAKPLPEPESPNEEEEESVEEEEESGYSDNAQQAKTKPSKSAKSGRGQARKPALPKSASMSKLDATAKPAASPAKKRKSMSARDIARQAEESAASGLSEIEAEPIQTASTSRSKGRKGKAKEVTSTQVQPERLDRSASSSSPLPSGLPFPLSSQTGPAVWDFEMLNSTLFVTVPASRKDSPAAEASETDGPLFWWPARITSRNRLNFRVAFVLDKQKQILQFT